MLLIKFTRFALVGGVATSIQYLLLFILVHWTGSNPVLASSLGFVVSAFANYLLNYHYTFRSKHQHGTALLKFMVIAGVGLILNSTIMQTLTVEGLHYLIAQVIATAGVLLWSFTGNNLWTFRTAPVARITTPEIPSRENRNTMRSDGGVTSAVKFISIILLAILALLIVAQKEPLEGMHWDVPIYLYQAKRFAETHYLINYIRHADEIAAQIDGHWPASEGYSESYWRFVRLGHIAILGAIVSFLGSSFQAIVTMTWLYNLFLIGGLTLIFLSSVQIGSRAELKYRWFVGAALSMMMFLLSDIYRYLAGNLVSEVSSIFFVGASVFSLLRAFETKWLIFAVMSGLFAFLGYTMRMESIWPWLTFIIAYIATRGAGIHSLVPWKPILIAGLTAIGCYVIYAIVFSPLAYPWHGFAFIKSMKMGEHEHDGVPGYKLMFAAGGLLWIGALSSLGWLRQSSVLRLGWLWLVGCALLSIPTIFFGAFSQTRMLTTIIPPLFLLSAGGWAMLLRKGLWHTKPIAMIGLGFCLFLISEPTTYTRLRNLPGGWKLQYARAFLVAPKYERINYLPQEMRELSNILYTASRPTVLICTKEITGEYRNMIRFFGTGYPVDADLAMVVDPVNPKKCEDSSPNPNEPVVFCNGYTDPARMKIDTEHYRLLVLHPTNSPTSFNAKMLLGTKTFALDEIQN